MASPHVQPYLHRHPLLGQIRGIIRGSDVVQFRGIPFADIPARFRQSRLRTELPQQPFDATQPGPFCPQTTLNPFPPFWTGPLPEDHPILRPTQYDEWSCLNLNVSAPASALGASKLPPVLVYIHGGAFMSGGNGVQISGREVADPTTLIRRMEARGKPLVVVNINYRVGPFGFLASKELTAFNQSHGEAVGNYGLHDQRTALEWVSRFIAGFGGDSENITIAGGSAGGASCHWQAIFPDRKIKRAILSSGTALALAALPIDRHQKSFDQLASKLGTGNGRDIIHELQKVGSDDLVSLAGGTQWPCIDGEWITSGGLEVHEGAHDIPDLLIGWTTYEEDLTYAVLGSQNPLTDSGMRAILNTFLETAGLLSSADVVYQPKVLEAYNMENARIELRPQDLQSCAELSADVIFKIPPVFLASQHTHGKIYLWNLQATNPFPGWPPGYQKAHHALTDILIFDVASDLVPPQHRDEYNPPVKQLQEDWIDFCYGNLDWEEYRAGNEAMGPVYTYENHGRGGKRDRLLDVVGEEIIGRWREVLKVCT